MLFRIKAVETAVEASAVHKVRGEDPESMHNLRKRYEGAGIKCDASSAALTSSIPLPTVVGVNLYGKQTDQRKPPSLKIVVLLLVV